MCTVAIPFDQWAVDYHSTMAAVSEVGTSIKSGSSILGLVKDFWRVDRKFRALISDLEKIRQMPPDQLRNMTDKLIGLSETVEQVLVMASRKGLTNRTLVNGSIQSLRKRNAELVDFTERFELSLHPGLADVIASAREEYTRGEVVGLEAITK